MCFEWISEQTAIISIYNINLSAFITEAESVYCAVRTGSLNQIQFRPYRINCPACPVRKCGVANSVVTTTLLLKYTTHMKVRICGDTEGGIVWFEMRMSVNSGLFFIVK
jgi:hypothetical protein